MNYLRGQNELLQLIGGQDAYTKCCANKVDTPMQEIAWRLHFVCLYLLIDDERKPNMPEATPIEERQRFMALEGIDNETANKIQNVFRKKMGKEPIYNKTADAIDFLTGNLIELKCTPVFDDYETKYFKDSVETNAALGITLVICDTLNCRVLQPEPHIFVKGVTKVIQLLLKRNEIMDKWNMNDKTTHKLVEYKELPKFLDSLFDNMGIREEEYFDINTATYNSKTKTQIEKEITGHKEVIERLKIKTEDMSLKLQSKYDTQEMDTSEGTSSGITSSRKRKLFDNEINDRIFKKLRLEKNGKKIAAYRSGRKEYYNARANLLKRKTDLKKAEDELYMVKKPCCNKRQPIVVRDLNAEKQHPKGFLQEMKFEDIDKLIRAHDLECETKNLECKWQYGVPPVVVMESLTNLDKHQFFADCEFFEPLKLSKDGQNDFDGFKILVEEMKKDPNNILNLGTSQLSRVMRDSDARKALDLFGVGWKKVKQIGEMRPEGLKMKFETQYETPNRGFPTWFYMFREGLKGNHTNDKGETTYVYPTLTREETISAHPISNFVTQKTNQMMSKIVETKLAHNMNLVQNLSYKLAGRASSNDSFVKEKKEGKKQFNNMRVFAFELETVTYTDHLERTGKFSTASKNTEEDRKRREVYGYIFRGPSHAKNASDITNCFLFVFFDDDYSGDEAFCKVFPQYTLGKFKYGEKMMNYGIRRWGYKRVAPTYSCYIANALYEPMNSIGDKMFKILEENGYRDFKDPKLDISNFMPALVNNAADNFIIGINMNNSDEGLMPFNRYLHLNLQSLLSDEKCFCLDFESFKVKFMEAYKIAGVVKFFTKLTCNIAMDHINKM